LNGSRFHWLLCRTFILKVLIPLFRSIRHLLACIVVLQDPLCRVQPHQAVKWDVRFSFHFSCSMFPFDFIRNPTPLCYWSGQLPYAKRLRSKLKSAPFGFWMRLQLRCRRHKIAKPDTPKVQTGSVLNSCGFVSRILCWLSLLIFALTPQGLATFMDVVPVSGSPLVDSDDLTSSTIKSKPVPPPSFLDALLMFENPHLDFRRMAKQQKKLLRSLRFSSSSRK